MMRLALPESRAVPTALSLVVLSAVIWLGGPYCDVGDGKPLESTAGRLVAVILLAAAHVAYLLLRGSRDTRNNKRLADEMRGQQGIADTPESADAQIAAGEAAHMSVRFEDAIQALKKSKRQGARLRDLPWYIVVGPPGAGKTTLLLNSGLTFPLDEKLGKESVRGIGGTRSCDWWFTDQAVLLDTAGRYMTQDANSRSDAAGWAVFLRMLCRHRRRRPVNGVIIAMSAQDLLTSTPRERDEHVKAIRRRLAELSRQLQIDFPVYFLVTKCDLVAGFTGFFGGLEDAARSQVWGVTFPLTVSGTGAAVESFASEVEALLGRLESHMFRRIHEEREPRSRVADVAFPQQMALLASACGDLLQKVFTMSKFDTGVLLRGLYFTSATQEGTPVDRLLTGVARTFGLGGAVTPSASGQGRAYFLESLLNDVIFREAGLAGAQRKLRAQKLAAHSAAYAACAVLSALLVGGLLVSYSANAHYIDAVSRAATSLKVAEPGSGTAATTPETFLPALDALRAVTDTAEKYRSAVPWWMGMGLYRGNSLGAAARDAYAREINGILPPVLTERFEHELRTSPNSDTRRGLLKAYLMLGDARQRDPEYLEAWADREWPRIYGTDEAATKRVAEHFKQLFADGDRLVSQRIDPKMVELR
jgi:type VI secretion system protein ImpL